MHQLPQDGATAHVQDHGGGIRREQGALRRRRRRRGEGKGEVSVLQLKRVEIWEWSQNKKGLDLGWLIKGALPCLDLLLVSLLSLQTVSLHPRNV